MYDVVCKQAHNLINTNYNTTNPNFHKNPIKQQILIMDIKKGACVTGSLCSEKWSTLLL